MATTDQHDLPARIRLARSRPRLLAVPVVVGTAGAAAVVLGILGAPAPVPIALAVLGALVIVGAMVGALLLLSVRFEVSESAVSLLWLGGRRDYGLVPGPVTRVQLRGRRRSSLRPRSGALGWGIGPARLRGEEEIELVRLASTPSAILVPTDRGRLAVAPEDEHEFLTALARAAQARQRTEDQETAAAAAAGTEAEAAEADADLDAPPSSLTGIERSLLEERLARERAEMARAAETARRAVEVAAGTMEEAAPEATPVAAEAPASLGWRRSRTGFAMALLPTLAAGLAWWIGLLAGGTPPPGTDLARLVSVALVLAGPATSIGALMSLAWWPRLVGVVVTGGLVATVFIGRTFIG